MGSSKSPVGVMMVNFGVPTGTSQSEVNNFLRSYATDDRVVGKLAMTIRNLLHAKQFKESLSIASHRFAEIADGDEFPYNKICKSLRRKVADQLQQLGAENVVTIVAYRYGARAMSRGFAHLRKLGCRHIVVLPLYPQSSYGFTASVHDEYRRARRKASRGMEFRFVDNFYDDPGYIRAIVNRIRDNVGLEKLSSAKFVFAFRSTPLRDVSHGDTYELQTSASALAIANDLGLDRKQWTIAYIPYDQMGRRPGLEPTIHDVVDRFALGHINNVVVVCPGQVTDSVDTLFEVDHRMRSQLEHAFERDGESCEFVYVPALNDSDDFAYALADIIYNNMYGWEDHFAHPSARRMRLEAGQGSSSGSGSLSGSGASPRLGSGVRTPSASGSGPLSSANASGARRALSGDPNATGSRPALSGDPNATGSRPAMTSDPNTTGSRQASAASPNATGSRSAMTSDPNATGSRQASAASPNATGSRQASAASPNATGSRSAMTSDPNATGPLGNPNTTGSRPALSGDPNATGSRQASAANPNATGSRQASAANPNATGSRQASTTSPNTTGSHLASSANPNTTGSRNSSASTSSIGSDSGSEPTPQI